MHEQVHRQLLSTLILIFRRLKIFDLYLSIFLIRDFIECILWTHTAQRDGITEKLFTGMIFHSERGAHTSINNKQGGQGWFLCPRKGSFHCLAFDDVVLLKPDDHPLDSF